MQESSLDIEQILGEVIYRYTRSQALADGVLVDITETARQAGFRVPVAMTAAAWSKAIAWSDADSARQTHQDERGRLWDVVWMGYMAARRVSAGCRVPFQLYVVPRGGAAIRPKLMTLHMVIGPGDEGEPVITIMNPNED
ncbi:DUF6573 family protein [Burkholderia sp. MSMB1589WGS]|uniref:DUF6573 family protein n=1 Tax=Burkholderia sp. MSMB1589WGS TaxID=1636425 RepID=UPI0007B959CE|nr:DUF6573 family protein [Burkholderia sp. MSMB1589WGS]